MSTPDQHKPTDPSFLTNTSNENDPWLQRIIAEDYGGQLKQWLKNVWLTNKSLVVLVLFMVLGVGVSAGILLNGQNTDSRSQASISNGSAIILLSPTGSNLTPNTPQKIDVMVTTSSKPVVGFQVVTTFSGRVPSDLKFVPAPMENFQVIRNTLVNNRLEFASILPPQDAGFTPFSTQTPIVLGSFEFTAPSRGDMTISFIANETLIPDFETGLDVSRAPSPTKYIFSAPKTGSKPRK